MGPGTVIRSVIPGLVPTAVVMGPGMAVAVVVEHGAVAVEAVRVTDILVAVVAAG